MVALSLLRLVNRTDETVVREHWQGGGDIVSLADSIAGVAPVLLPKRISRVLVSKVEMAPAGKVVGKALGDIGKRHEALLQEVPQTAEGERLKVDSRSSMTN